MPVYFKSYTRKLLIICLAVTGYAVLGLVIQGLNPPSAHATSDVMITNEVPMSGAVTNAYNGSNGRAYFMVGTGTSTDNKYAYAKIYLPVNPATGKNYQATITINWGLGVCNGGPSAPIDSGTPNVDYNLQDMSDTESLTSGNFVGYFATANSLAAGNACANKSIVVPANSALASTITGHTGYAVLYFEAVINNPLATDVNKVFYVNAAATTGNAYGSISRPVKDYGTGGNVAHDQNYIAITNNTGFFTGFNYGVQISPRCGEYQTQTAVPSTAIGMYDADRTQQPSLQFTVQTVAKFDATATTTTWPAPTLTVPGTGLGDNNVYNSTSMSFFAFNNNRYKLNYNNYTTWNTIQTKLPFDQFDSINNCYKMVCTAVYPPGIVRPGIPLNVTITAGNAGTVSWDSSVLLSNFSTTYNMTQPPSNPPIDPGEAATYKFTIVNNTLGTYTVNYTMFSSIVGCSLTYTVASVPLSSLNVTCKRLNGYVWFPNNLSGATRGKLVVQDMSVPSYQAGATYTTPDFPTSGGSYNAATADPTQTPPPGAKWFSFDMFFTGTHTSYGGPDWIFGGSTGYNGGFGSYNAFPYHTYHITLYGLDQAGTTYQPLTFANGQEAAADLSPCFTFNTCNVTMNPASPAVNDTVTYTAAAAITNNTDINYTGSNFFTTGGGGYNAYSLNVDTTNISPGTNAQYYPIIINTGTNNYGAPLPASYTGTITALPASVTLTIGFGAGSDYTQIVPCSKTVQSIKLPYFKVFNGDTSAGGGFNVGTGSNNCVTAYAGSYHPGSAIKAYADSSTSGAGSTVARRVGSSTEFAAFALGVIAGDTNSSKGFYSGKDPTLTSVLSIANTPDVMSATQWGGGLANVHCLPDWYGAFSTGLTIDTSQSPAISYDLNNAAANAAGNNNRIGIWGDSGVNIIDGLNPVNIANSSTVIKNRRTIVVLGDVHLQTNIINDPSWTWSLAAPQPPQLTLIVKGDIFIDPQVTRLDGVFVTKFRQATSPAQLGNIVTCGYAFRAATAGEVTNNCNNQLVVNGSLISEQIQFLRSYGALSAAAASGSAESLGSAGNAAEVINASPLISIGSAFYDDSTSLIIKADSTLNLPPVL